MAREEQPREDLLAEATGLVERVELRVPGSGESVVVGFRRQGAASFFFDQDPAYHFNSQRQLRRAYAGGNLYKAEAGRMVRLTRDRGSGQETVLRRYELTPIEQATLLVAVRDSLRDLRAALQGRSYTLVGQRPVDADVLSRVERWLAEVGDELEAAERPNVA